MCHASTPSGLTHLAFTVDKVLPQLESYLAAVLCIAPLLSSALQFCSIAFQP